MNVSPRSFTQILGGSLQSVADSWKPLATTSLMVFVPVGLLSLFVFRWTGGTAFLEVALTNPGALETMPEEILTGMLNDFLTAAAIAAGIQGLATLFVYLAAHHIVAASSEGTAVTGSDARRHALNRFLPTLLAAVLALIVVIGTATVGLVLWGFVFGGSTGLSFVAILSFILAVVPSLWFAVSFSMLTVVASLEDNGVVGSLRRSVSLVKARWGPTLGYLVLVGLLGTIAAQMIQLIALPLASMDSLGLGVSIASVLGLFAQGVIVGSIGAMWTGWYLDLRSRGDRLQPGDLV